MVQVSIASSEKDIARCFPVLVQLRTSLTKEECIKRVKGQQQSGYLLAFLTEDNAVQAVAGFRIAECLSWGRFLYVDDLITDANSHSKGYGDKLFDWLVEYAKSNKCKELHLDSGVQRFDAHRFYLKKRMSITCHSFALQL
jgi:GNAT superfamily N-acetyltransferase